MARRCGCCGGAIPDVDIWEANRHLCESECTGSVEPMSGRCRAWADDDLWSGDDQCHDPDAEVNCCSADDMRRGGIDPRDGDVNY